MVASTIWIAMLAGCVNAFTAMALLFERSGYMSGRATDLGMGLMAPFVLTDKATITGLFEEALIILIITVAFVAGGILGTKLMRAIGLGKTLIIVSLFIFTAYLMVIIEIPAGVVDVFSFERSLWAFLFCFPMGMQNAITTLTLIGRTTHVTGTLTDLGISIASGTHKRTIHVLCRWLGFAFGGSVGLLIFFHIPFHCTQLLILAIATIVTGGFYAHPAIKRRLGPVISIKHPISQVAPAPCIEPRGQS
jgi:uncharacterized membrane protein YoaK (UPF0700 family)